MIKAMSQQRLVSCFLSLFFVIMLHVSFAFLHPSCPLPLRVQQQQQTQGQSPTQAKSPLFKANLCRNTSSSSFSSLFMAKSPTIDQWTFSSNGGITGIVKDSPNTKLFQNGETLTTSKIKSSRNLMVEGAVVTTESGSNYTLGAKRGSTTASSASSASSTIPTIRNWTINLDGTITGNVYGGPRKRNGDYIQTSSITKSKDSVKQGDVVTTISGSKYQLGNKKSAIQQRSPLFQTLPKRNTKPPRPFANIPSKQSKEQQQKPQQVPLLDRWTLDRQTRLNGIISNSPFTYETDGKSVLTKPVVTDSAFIVEGFTIVTADERMYKLGTPKQNEKDSSTTDEVIVYGTPIIIDWDVSSNNRIIGTMQNTNDPKIPNGEIVITDPIITNPLFIAEGYNVVSSSGNNYKLGPRDQGSSSSFKFPSISVSPPKIPKISTPKQSAAPKAQVQPKKDVAATTTTTTSTTTTLEDWTFDDLGRVTGTITNCEDNRRNGRVITTVQSTFPTMLFRTGVTVYDESGAAYKLGTEKTQEPNNKAKQQPLNRNNLALIDDWCMNGIGGVTGIVRNSQDPNVQDGDTLTTSKIMTEDIRNGQIIETLNGSFYILGTRNQASMVSSNTQIDSTDSSDTVGIGLWTTVAILFVLLSGGMY